MQRLLIAAAALSAVVLVACDSPLLAVDDVGDAPYCETSSVWTLASAQREDALLAAVNDVRQRGGTCGDEDFDVASPMTLVPQLRCAARVHANDQADAGSLAHIGSDGSTTLSRINRSGYDGIARHEVLAGDFVEATDVIEAWLASEPHCAAILDPEIEQMGAGHAETADGERTVWVLVTGAPRP